jgi:hypothetical protein
VESGRVIELLIWIPPSSAWGTWNGQLSVITKKVNEGRRAGVRPLSLSSAGAADELRRYSCELGPDEGLKWEARYSLGSRELETLLDAQQARGWRPDNLSCFWDDNEIRFMTVLVENRAKAAWSFRKDLSPAAYEQALVEENQRGMQPIAVASYLVGRETRYAAVWLATPAERVK